jgi:hypothetical protein
MKTGEFKKQFIIGITGTILSISALLLIFFIFPDLNDWVVYIILLILAPLIFGFIFYIFGGIKFGLFWGGIGFAFVAFMVAIKELPPWAGIALVVAAAFYFFVLPIIKDYKIDREKNSEKIISKKIAQELLMEDEFVKQIESEEEEFKKSIKFGEKSIIMISTKDGIYQVINSEEKYYFVRIGNSIIGIDNDLLITNFENDSVFATRKKDFIIDKSNIEKIVIKYGNTFGSYPDFTVRLSIVTGSKKMNFYISDTLSKDILNAFFSGISISVQEGKKKETTAKVLTDEEKAILPTLKKINLWLCIIGIMASLIFIFIPVNGTIYRIFSAVGIIIPIITLILYIKYNNIFSLDDRHQTNGSSDSAFSKESATIYIPLLVPPLALGLNSLSDFSVMDLWALLIWSAFAFALILFVFLKYTQEYKKAKSIIFFITIFALIFAPSAVVQINCLYDFSKPALTSTIIIDKYISEGEHSTDYIFTVKLKNGSKQDLPVRKAYYESLDKGADVSVIEKPGLLGIGFAYVDES